MSARVLFSVLCWLVGGSSQCAGQTQAEAARDLADRALAILRTISDPWTSKPVLYSKIAAVFARVGDKEGALELFDEAFENLDPDESEKSAELCEIAIYQSKAGLDERALATQEMISTKFFYPEGCYNELCLSGIAESLAQRGNLDKSRAVAHRIKLKYYRCSVFARLAAISKKQGKNEASRQLVADAVDCLMQESSNAAESASTLAPGVVYELVQGGLTGDASAVVATMAASAADRYDWHILVQMQGMCGNVDGVRAAAAELMEHSGSPSDQPFCTLHLGQAQAKAGLLDEACRNARLIRDDEDKFYAAVRFIAQEFVRQNRLGEALEINQTITNHSRPHYYETLLDVALAEHNLVHQEEAKKLLAEVRGCIAGITSYRGHYSSFDKLELVSQVHGELGLLDELEKWIGSFESPHAKVSALIGMANGVLNRAEK